MTQQPPDFDHETFLLSTVLEIGGREFEVTVMHDGYSHWFDNFRKKEVLRANPGILIDAATGDENIARHIAHLHDEYTLKALVPESGLRIIRNELSPAYWSDAMEGMPDFDQRLDAILEPIFWQHINPQLSPPVEPGT